jgi:hypothetical protein
MPQYNITINNVGATADWPIVIPGTILPVDRTFILMIPERQVVTPFYKGNAIWPELAVLWFASLPNTLPGLVGMANRAINRAVDEESEGIPYDWYRHWTEVKDKKGDR